MNVNSFFSLFDLSELGPKITPGCSPMAGTYSKFCNLRGSELSSILDNFSQNMFSRDSSTVGRIHLVI